MTKWRDNRAGAVRILAALMLIAAAACILAASTYEAAAAGSEAVAAKRKKYGVKYLADLSASASGQDFGLVKDIYIHSPAKEIYVLDAGNKRVIIFDYAGVPQFWFSVLGPVQSTQLNSVTTTKDGSIYIGAETMVLKYSYRGRFIKNLDIERLGKGAVITSVNAGDDGVLYVGYRVHMKQESTNIVRLGIASYDADDNLKNIMTVASDKYTDIFDLTRLGNKFYFMAASTVKVVTLDTGAVPVSAFGQYSSLLGGFSQPISLDVTKDFIYVADLNRKLVILFDHAGNPIIEFGGPTTFAFPGKVAVDEEAKVYVADRANVRIFEVRPEPAPPSDVRPK